MPDYQFMELHGYNPADDDPSLNHRQGTRRTARENRAPVEDHPGYSPEHWRRIYAAQETAKKALQERSFAPPPAGRSLADARKKPPRPPVQIIEDVFPEGIDEVAGQFKVGKTTLGLNVANALGSERDFLGAFPVHFRDGAISYWNLELDEPMMFSWQDKLIKSRAAEGRIFTENLRGTMVDLTLPVWQEWAINRLRACQARVWTIDPKGRMIRNENDNSEYNEWFRCVEYIAREAGIVLVLLLTHTGHASAWSGDARPRQRGASAQMGNTDANLSYYHGGELGEDPPDDYRYLAGFGRGIDLREVTLKFDHSTGLLRLDEVSRGRKADRKEREADEVATILAADKEYIDKGYLNRGELEVAIGGHKNSQGPKINSALHFKTIVCKKSGREQQYRVNDADQKTRISAESG